MLPLFLVNYVEDGSRANTIIRSEFCHRIVAFGIQIPDLYNLLLCQLSCVVRLSLTINKTFWLTVVTRLLTARHSFWKLPAKMIIASGWIQTSFVSSIDLVVSICAKEQVRWITAGRVVTSVTYEQVQRVKIIRNKVRHSRGPKHSLPSLKESISFSVFSSSPRPAVAFGFLTHVATKAINFWLGKLWQRRNMHQVILAHGGCL